MAKILIVEDDKNIAKVIATTLEMVGYDYDTCASGTNAVKSVFEGSFDLILLDIMIPELDGFEVMERIREKGVPVIFLTAMQNVADKVKGLRLGADDYIVKPFSPSELVARVTAHINRYERLVAKGGDASQDRSDCVEIGGIRIEKLARRVFVDGKEIILSNKEFDLLLFLASNPNVVFSRDQLFDKIWGLDSFGETSTVTVHINKLREKIEKDMSKPQYIETVWGAGYRFKQFA